MELAREVLGGKYEFVLTTHIDRDHVHNHLIFNAVSFQDHRHYHSNKRSYHEIRRTSDRICKEHGLSVIVPGRDKGKSYIEHQAEQNGTSYKAKLRSAIVVKTVASLASFEGEWASELETSLNLSTFETCQFISGSEERPVSTAKILSLIHIFQFHCLFNFC